MSSSRLDVTCRPARPDDTPQVLELTSEIWEGHDYVPSVWEDWLADPQGRLIVAEQAGRVLGLSKLSRLSELDWWMEGLRVHPQFEGQGIASQLTEATVQTWLEIGCGTVRLGTASFRLPVHHMCARLGFVKLNEWAPYYAPGQTGAENSAAFQPVLIQEVDEAVYLALNSQSLELSSGLMDLSWRYAPPRDAYLSTAVEQGLAWWWRGRQGLLTAHIDEDDELGEAPSIQLLACTQDEISQILLEFRSLAASLGYAQAAWMVPLLTGIVPAVESAGYQRKWENSLFIFARSHPLNPLCKLD